MRRAGSLAYDAGGTARLGCRGWPFLDLSCRRWHAAAAGRLLDMMNSPDIGQTNGVLLLSHSDSEPVLSTGLGADVASTITGSPSARFCQPAGGGMSTSPIGRGPRSRLGTRGHRGVGHHHSQHVLAGGSPLSKERRNRLKVGQALASAGADIGGGNQARLQQLLGQPHSGADRDDGWHGQMGMTTLRVQPPSTCW